jgi:hypothetical protein
MAYDLQQNEQMSFEELYNQLPPDADAIEDVRNKLRDWEQLAISDKTEVEASAGRELAQELVTEEIARIQRLGDHLVTVQSMDEQEIQTWLHADVTKSSLILYGSALCFYKQKRRNIEASRGVPNVIRVDLSRARWVKRYCIQIGNEMSASLSDINRVDSLLRAFIGIFIGINYLWGQAKVPAVSGLPLAPFRSETRAGHGVAPAGHFLQRAC